MSKSTMSRCLTVVAMVLAMAGLAEAQATRTWVSGVGDDANPCSRTAPCKTFAGAISKTAAGGEISVLDPGGFGAVTITKAISIVADGSEGGILSAGTHAVVVNAGVNDVVTLRGLVINGAGTGLNGIRYLAGKELHVERCSIEGVTGDGIDVSLATNGLLHLRDVSMSRVAVAGVDLSSTTGVASAVIDRLHMTGGQYGVRVGLRSLATVRDCLVSATTVTAVKVEGGAREPQSIATLEGCSLIGNAEAVEVGPGLAVVRLAGNLITDNTVGLSHVAGSLLSFGDNRIHGNGVSASPSPLFLQ